VIWVWLKKSFIDALKAIGYLLIPPPPSYKPPVPHRVISPNADCPACGGCSGKIECVPRWDKEVPALTIQHTCSICGGAWYEPLVVEGDTSLIHPSLNSLV
jgi:hypothetical protein